MSENRTSVLTEGEAAREVGLSQRTLQRLRLDGGGPPFVQLTAHRIGYRIETLRQWVAARERVSTADATVNKAA